jgi:hypothetical protein
MLIKFRIQKGGDRNDPCTSTVVNPLGRYCKKVTLLVGYLSFFAAVQNKTLFLLSKIEYSS